MSGASRSLGFQGPLAVLSMLVVLTAITACRKRTTPAPAPSAQPKPLCVEGRSIDPPRAETREATEAAKDANHARAAQLLDKLLPRYPESAALRVWRGDAALF